MSRTLLKTDTLSTTPLSHFHKLSHVAVLPAMPSYEIIWDGSPELPIGPNSPLPPL